MANKPFFRRRKVCPFSGENAQRSITKIQNCFSAISQSVAKLFHHASLLFLPRNNVNWRALSNVHASWRYCPIP